LFLGCHGFWQAVEVYLIGGERFQAGVRPDGVIELQVAADGSSGLADRGVSVQVDLLVLDGLPDALDEDVVASREPSNTARGARPTRVLTPVGRWRDVT